MLVFELKCCSWEISVIVRNTSSRNRASTPRPGHASLGSPANQRHGPAMHWCRSSADHTGRTPTSPLLERSRADGWPSVETVHNVLWECPATADVLRVCRRQIQKCYSIVNSFTEVTEKFLLFVLLKRLISMWR
jgi:hypothetical protein